MKSLWSAPSTLMCWTCIAPLTDGERAEQERERGPQRRSTAPEREHGAGRAGDRDQRGERVLGEVDAGLAVQEGVVERVDDRDPDRRGEEHGSPTRSVP